MKLKGDDGPGGIRAREENLAQSRTHGLYGMAYGTFHGKGKGRDQGRRSIGRQKEERENVLVVCGQWELCLPASAACSSTAGCPRPSLNHLSSVHHLSLFRAACVRVGNILVVQKKKRIRKACTHYTFQRKV